jgi:hypothetical protein
MMLCLVPAWKLPTVTTALSKRLGNTSASTTRAARKLTVSRDHDGSSRTQLDATDAQLL